MIRLYCHHKLNTDTLPEEYALLLEYARQRLAGCRFGEQKTSCRKCPIHCYSKEKRTLMRTVMRWCGPRMILYHPIITLRHYLEK